MPANEIEIDPVKLMRWLNVRKLTVPAFGTAIGVDAARLGAELGQNVLVWDADLAGRASDVLAVELDQLAVRAATEAAVYRSAASSEAERQTVRRDGIDFYNYYSLAGPRGHVAPVVLDILCPPDRLPALNKGHLEPAITVNLGPGDINGRWGEELTADTWSVLAANRGADRWICGDSYFEPSFCPHTYSLAGAEPARILSYTGASPLAGIVERTDSWPAESFTALLEELGERLTPAAVLAQSMRRRAFDVPSLCAATDVKVSALEDFLAGQEDALELSGLRRIGRTVRCDYRLLLAPDVSRDSVGKTSLTTEQSRASIRSLAGYTVADTAGSPAAPDLLGQFLLVERPETDAALDLRDPQATFYLVTGGSATARWRSGGGEVQQALGRWDSLWIGPNVAHGFTGQAGLLRMGDAGAFPYTDTLELSNTYRPAWTLGRARQDRQGWGYDK
jgi:2-hydroxyethylphosphonate dioxygenase